MFTASESVVIVGVSSPTASHGNDMISLEHESQTFPWLQRSRVNVKNFVACFSLPDACDKLSLILHPRHAHKLHIKEALRAHKCAANFIDGDKLAEERFTRTSSP